MVGRSADNADAAPAGRGAARERAILDATVGLLAEIGYEALTMDAVAARAHASKATIYRHWPGKAALVGQALRRCGPGGPVDIPHTGSLRGDLLAALIRLRDRFDTNERALLTGVLHAMQRDRELAEIMRTQLSDKRRAVLGEIERRARSYGIEPVGMAQVSDVMPGSIMMRLMVTGDPVDDAFLTGFVDHVLLPLLRREFAG